MKEIEVDVDNIYIKHGYKTRLEYLNSLAEEFNIDKVIVFTLAGVLGPSEDFDGLITSIEDYCYENEI